MIGWLIFFAIVALVAAILGFGTLAGVAAMVFKWLFVLFIILLVVSLIMSLTGRRGMGPV
ncbi:MAG: DUF1328 domain-containing protein [Armatimonadota bacterium]|nr:DUF1328 domain-containing protein [bacterium]